MFTLLALGRVFSAKPLTAALLSTVTVFKNKWGGGYMWCTTWHEPWSCTLENNMLYEYIYIYIVGFEIFAEVVMKSVIFWDMTPCSLLSCNRRFGGRYHLHLQGRRNNFSKNQQVSRWLAKSPTPYQPTYQTKTSAVYDQGTLAE
jgi:hypothetical protein